MEPQLETIEKFDKAEWKHVLSEEKQKSYFEKVLKYLETERLKGKIIFPPNKEIFNALHLTPFDQVKVVILGQDPYHGPSQAHGLCFSVKPGVPYPPSLQNIFKELKKDLGIDPPNHGCLEHWAKQGVLLLNAVLSVQAGQANSHKDIGWEQFTDKIIEQINKYKTGVIFLLWGSYAQKKGAQIDFKKHYVLKAPHPSPLSAHRGFFGCKHFSKVNQILRNQGLKEIDWKIPNI